MKMNKRTFLMALALLFSGTAFGGLDRIYYSNGWKTEKIITGIAFNDVAIDPAGTVYLARTLGGLGRIYESAGNWVRQPTLEAFGDTGMGTYAALDAINANYLFLIDSNGFERTRYSSGWKNEDLQAGSYNALSADRSQTSYHVTFLANSDGGVDRHLYSGGWQLDSDIGGDAATATYVDLEVKPGVANCVFGAGSLGLNDIHYSGSWQNDPVISGISLISLAHDENSSWKVFAGKAAGGLMQAYNTGPGAWASGDLNGAGSNVYVDLVADPGTADTLFMVNSDGGLETAWWNGSTWTNEVIVSGGNYVAIAADSSGEFYAVLSDPGPTWTPLYMGIDRAVLLESAPLINVLRIDLHDPDIGFHSTPSNGDDSLDSDSQTTRAFLTSSGVQVAINANYFAPCCSSSSEPKDLYGLAVSQGNVVSPGDAGKPELLISSNNVAWFDFSPPSSGNGGAYTAVAGWEPILANGAVVSDDTSAQNPLTLVGISQDDRYLYLLTVDGRQSYDGVWYEGAARAEGAAWLKECGAYNGLNLDGGGSTTMAMSDGAGGSTLLNVPSGQERLVGNSLGVFARALTPYRTWMGGYGLAGDDAAATHDYDADGLQNLGEYGMGGNPTNPADQGHVPVASVDGSWLNYIYPMRSGITGISYYLETTTNLVDGIWTNDGYTVLGTNADGYASGFDAVTNPVSTAMENQRFIHLKIQED